MSTRILSGKWIPRLTRKINSALSFIVFLILDLLDSILCVIYRFLDDYFEGHDSSSCYCQNREKQGNDMAESEEENKLSESLFGRKNLSKKMGFLGFARKCRDQNSNKLIVADSKKNRWSDCGCDSCLSWMNDEDHKLFIVVREPSLDPFSKSRVKSIENVIFLHGFLSSSSFWTETVFPNLTEPIKRDYKLFAIDLLGFGRSPKPRDCFYTLKDHLEMIEKSVICPFELNSFHLVAHSMGCLIAMALAAKYSNCVKSITLVAPPYFPLEDGGDLRVLEKLAKRRLWPPLLFGSSYMSWYEHLGRCVCLLICKNHRVWERMLKLLTRRKDLHYMIRDLTRHTHHSAWHNMHNVICGGSKLMESYLDILTKAKVKFFVVQGDQDQVIPVECSKYIKTKAPDSKINIISNANHSTVILGREKEFTKYLEHIWVSVSDAPS